MTRSLPERVALGLVDAERKRRAAAAGSAVVEVDGLVLAFSNLPNVAPLNGVYVEREPSDPIAALAAAEEEFRRRGVAFGIDLQRGRHAAVDDAVRAVGLNLLFVRPALVVTIGDMPIADAPSGVTFRAVASDEEALALAGVDAEAFQGDLEVSERFYAPGWDMDGVCKLVAWLRDEPVGAAASYLHEGSVGIFGVAVVPSARHRGIGSAITAASISAFPGADLAWLHPTEVAVSMYERLGFRKVSDWEVWVRPASDVSR